MSWEIKHRYTGEVLRSGDGNLSEADLSGADLRRADLSGAYLSEADLRRADLSGAYLSEADLSEADLCGAYLSEADLSEADLRRADLRGADLSEADLSEADLCEADLRRADLRGADLSGAYLRGADLCGTCVIDLGQRSDGYQFFLQLRDKQEPLVLAGCRYFPLSEARTHWLNTRNGTQLGDESQAMLDHGERLLKIREVAR